jgi:hypothetical protein
MHPPNMTLADEGVEAVHNVLLLLANGIWKES